MTFFDLLSVMLRDALWSGIAATGFAILFNVPRRALIYCILAGAVGHAVRTLMMEQFGFSIVAATFFGATVVGFISRYCAYRLKMPSLIFAVSGAIPLVPGVFAYSTMIGILRVATAPTGLADALLIEAITNGIKTALILGAIATGIVAHMLIFDHPKPVV